MDQYKRLYRNIRDIAGVGRKITIWQGVVESVEGLTCTVRFAAQKVSGVRLRASIAEDEAQMLIVPAAGSAVTVGSLSGDLAQLVVLKVDRIERIEVNGGQLGGLVNIHALTDKINELVEKFNAHVHTIQTGQIITPQGANTAPVTVPAVQAKAKTFKAEDYEDDKITH